MPRNPKHIYRYPHFDPSSLVWQKLMEDVKRTGITVDALIVVRLTDYYVGDKQTEEVPMPTVAATSDIQRNALAAAAAWGDDDEDTSPTEPQLTAIKMG